MRIRRALQYAQACLGTRRLAQRARAAHEDSAAVFQTVASFAGGYYRPVQIESEFVWLLDQVRELSPQVIVEIGTVYGGTLLSFLAVAPDDARAVSIDLPGGEFGGGYSEMRANLFRAYAPGRVDCLRVDSHSPTTLDALDSLLQGRPVDFLFIDGDHSYEGVKLDFEMYAPRVRPGGVIAFHDVAKSYAETQVERFWREVRIGRLASEECHDPEGYCGIGVLKWRGADLEL